MIRWEIWRTESGRCWLEAPCGRAEYPGVQWRIAAFTATTWQAVDIYAFLRSGT